MEITVRPVLQFELPLLASSIRETSEAQLSNRWQEQDNGYRELLVAEAEGELLGTVSIREVRRGQPAMHLFALEVATDRRGRGVGTAIIESVIQEASRRGCRSVYLEVEKDNPARRLYHRLGFRRVGAAFMNSWWQFNDDGSRDQQNELSYRMVRRLAPGPKGRRAAGTAGGMSP